MTNAKPSRQLPKYGEPEVAVLSRFLAAYLTHAQTALASEMAIATGNEDHPLFAGRVTYWKNAVSVIEWLGAMIHEGQRHLLDVPLTEYEAELIKCIQSWKT